MSKTLTYANIDTDNATGGKSRAESVSNSQAESVSKEGILKRISRYKEAHPKAFKGIIAGACILLIAAIAVGVGISEHQKAGLMKESDEKDDVISGLEDDKQDLQDELDKLKTQQDFDPSAEQVSTISNWVVKRNSQLNKVNGFKGFSVTGNKVLLVFEGRTKDGDNVNVTVSVKMEEKTFKTNNVMDWLDEQNSSKNPDDWSEISVFENVKEANYSSDVKDRINQVTAALSKKETVVTDVNEDTGVVGVNTPEQMFSVETPLQDDGTYRLNVKRLVQDKDGEYSIETLSSEKNIGTKALSKEEATALGLELWYQAHYGNQTQTQDVELEA